MQPDVELESWRRDWQKQEVVLPDLAARVERETRLMRRLVLADSAVVVLIGGGTLAWALVSRRLDVVVLAIGVWILIAAATVTSILLRRGAWEPVAVTTAAFLELSILRCRRKRQALVAQAVLYVLLLTFDLTWLYYGQSAPLRVWTFLGSPAIAWVWPVTIVLAVVAAWYRRRLARNLANLVELQRQIE